LGGRLATDGDRLNFLTNIHARASHYRLSDSSATRDRPPAREHDVSVRSACESQASGVRNAPAPMACASNAAVKLENVEQGSLEHSMLGRAVQMQSLFGDYSVSTSSARPGSSSGDWHTVQSTTPRAENSSRALTTWRTHVETPPVYVARYQTFPNASFTPTVRS
jgi:hypothetical protein